MKIIKYQNSYFDEILQAFVEFQDKTEVDVYKTFSKSPFKKIQILKKILLSLIKSSKFCFLVIEDGKFCVFYCFSQYLDNQLMLDLVFVNPKTTFSEKIFNSFFQIESIITKTKYKNEIFARLYKRKNFNKYVNFVLRRLNFKKVNSEKEFTLVRKILKH